MDFGEEARLVEDSDTHVVPAPRRSRVVFAVIGSVCLLAAVGTVVFTAPIASNMPKASAIEKVSLAGDQLVQRNFDTDYGDDTACRADCEDKTVHGRNNITLLTIATVDECVERCKKDDGCLGVEFSKKFKRCELWHTPVGNIYKRPDFHCFSFLHAPKCDVDDGTGRSSVYPCACGHATCSEAAGLCHAAKNLCAQVFYTCPKKQKLGVTKKTRQVTEEGPTRNFDQYDESKGDHGEGTACRADCEDKTENGRNNITLLTIATLDECVERCKGDDGCLGIEFSKKFKRCELWHTPVGDIYKRTDFRCFSFLDAPKCDVDDGSGRSSVYPCACGHATCSEAAGVCHAATNLCAQKSDSCPKMPKELCCGQDEDAKA